MNEDERAFRLTISELTDELAELLVKKRKAYGTDNLVEFGTDGILIRMSDKRNRLKSMMLQRDDTIAGDESKRDAWIDIAGYALLALAFMDHGPKMVKE